MSNLNINSFEDLSCKEVFDIYVKRYIHELGDGDPQHALEIGTQVSLNGIIDRYVKRLHSECKPPTYQEIFSILNAPPFFFKWFNSETLCLGALMVLTYWHELGNTNSEIISARNTTRIAKSIIQECSNMESVTTNNFYIRFYRDIEEELKKVNMEDNSQPANSNFRAFIIRKVSGPLEYPFNVNPDICYYNLELEFEGEIYLLREEKPFDFIDENGTYQINKRLFLKITDYSVERRNGFKVLVEIKRNWDF